MTLASLLVVLLQLGAFVLALKIKHWDLGRICYAVAMLLSLATRVIWFLSRKPDEWQPVIESLAAGASLLCFFYSYTLWRHPERTP